MWVVCICVRVIRYLVRVEWQEQPESGEYPRRCIRTVGYLLYGAFSIIYHCPQQAHWPPPISFIDFSHWQRGGWSIRYPSRSTTPPQQWSSTIQRCDHIFYRDYYLILAWSSWLMPQQHPASHFSYTNLRCRWSQVFDHYNHILLASEL